MKNIFMIFFLSFYVLCSCRSSDDERTLEVVDKTEQNTFVVKCAQCKNSDSIIIHENAFKPFESGTDYLLSKNRKILLFMKKNAIENYVVKMVRIDNSGQLVEDEDVTTKLCTELVRIGIDAKGMCEIIYATNIEGDKYYAVFGTKVLKTQFGFLFSVSFDGNVVVDPKSIDRS